MTKWLIRAGDYRVLLGRCSRKHAKAAVASLERDQNVPNGLKLRRKWF